MSPLRRDRVNPRDIAAQAMTAGRFHDVVVSASKAIHDEDLARGDIETLRWAKSLLGSAGSTRSVVTMPPATELSGPSNPIMILRRAAKPTAGEDPDKTLRELSEDITEVIQGHRSDHLRNSLESLRTIFLMVSRLSLGAEVAARTEEAHASPWPPSMTTLHS